MTGLIILIILVPVVMLLLLINLVHRTGEQQRELQDMHRSINGLSQQIASLHKELSQKKTDSPAIASAVKEEKEKELPVMPPQPPVVVVMPDKAPKKIQPEREAVPVSATVEDLDDRQFREDPAPSMKKEAWFSGDLEKFIGENLANKIGIAVLVLGISFFVKYAIDRNWINESGRVIIGLASGSILVGIAHYIRNSYRSFSSVLVGGGLTVFYFTIAFAFHQYQLISQSTAFICMILITTFAVLLSIFYDRKELAIMATIGGFITPFLASTGNENYIALFIYLGILCTGLTFLSWFKRWPVINIIALLFTTIIYGGWVLRWLFLKDTELFPYQHAILFASLFYLLFVAMSVLNNLRLGRSFKTLDFLIVLGINFLYYAAGMLVFSFWDNGKYQGVFTAGLGIFNLILAAIFNTKKKIDPVFVSLLIGLSVTFLSLTAPVAFSGNHIVLFWAAEAVVLYWLYQRSHIGQLKIASLALTILMLASLVLNWITIYIFSYQLMDAIINKGFITSMVSAISLFVYSRLLKKEAPGSVYLGHTPSKLAASAYTVLTILVSYIAGLIELVYQLSTRFPQEGLPIVYLQGYTFGAVLLVLWIFRRVPQYAMLKFGLTGFCFLLYLLFIGINNRLSFELLSTGKGLLFWVHWVSAALLGWLLYDLLIFFFRAGNSRWRNYQHGFTWLACSGIVILLSVEMYHIILWMTYRDATDWYWWQNLYYKAGLSILWSICSFTMMWLGMKYSFRTLRVISLTLFTITLLKLFIYDIRNIPPGGKIAAFILLGVILLTVSFMYQRLKKMIIDDEKK